MSQWENYPVTHYPVAIAISDSSLLAVEQNMWVIHRSIWQQREDRNMVWVLRSCSIYLLINSPNYSPPTLLTSPSLCQQDTSSPRKRQERWGALQCLSVWITLLWCFHFICEYRPKVCFWSATYDFMIATSASPRWTSIYWTWSSRWEENMDAGLIKF